MHPRFYTFAFFCLLLTIVNPQSTYIDYTNEESTGTTMQQTTVTDSATTAITATTTTMTVTSGNNTVNSNTTMAHNGSAVRQQSVDNFFLIIAIFYLLFKQMN